VLAAVGIFDVSGNCARTNNYYAIPPLFKKIIIQINSKKLVIINNTRFSKDNKFATYYNGESHNPSFSFDELNNGGEIVYK